AEGCAARRLPGEDAGPRPHRDILEASVPEVAIQELLLIVAVAPADAIGLRIDMTVDDEDVGPGVQIEVDEPRAPAEVSAVAPQTSRDRRIVERAAAKIAIQRCRVIVEVRLDDVEPAVAVVVAGADAHARLRAAVGVERHASLQPDFRERPVAV